MEKKLWRFIDNFGSFESPSAYKIKSLYFPLANESLMSSVTPDLHGDIKSSQNSFLLSPVSRIDLTNSRSSRNFWVRIDKDIIWSLTGVSKDLKQIQEDSYSLNAGLLWHKIIRKNKKLGLKAEILSFVPSSGEPVEVMQVKLTNTGHRPIKLIPISAIPIYGRGADNIRDHRHVTSLFNRIILNKFGVILKPTLNFDENGHKSNKNIYFVVGWDQDGRPPKYIYPTQEMFCNDAYDLESPAAVLEGVLPTKESIHGKEAMAGLRFNETILRPNSSKIYILLMGISHDEKNIKPIMKKFGNPERVEESLIRTKVFWINLSQCISICSGSDDFDSWFRWVGIQPALRRIYGCSFLPDFDYGKGGRGWRDLWQDCLGLILVNPEQVKESLINNFSGVRIDGSNATIIGKNKNEFISDRNNISRVWMDHGVWPLLTLDLYMNETGDSKILFKEVTYFRNHELNRASQIDPSWNKEHGNKLKTRHGSVYRGTILEHLLVENLVQFLNVGRHNYTRLEGADWNDGLDMAGSHGESVAFSCMYAYNLKRLSEILLTLNTRSISVAEEIMLLLKETDYRNVSKKREILGRYFDKTKFFLSGRKSELNTLELSENLRKKSDFFMEEIRRKEWLNLGFFNGYYDNKGLAVEGRRGGILKMMLASQVFAVMSGVAEDKQIKSILESVRRYLRDKNTGGIHLNTNFYGEQPELGRAFFFAYGDKENGAYFNHMIVLFAYALYQRGYADDAWKVLCSIYNMSCDTPSSKIYPCIPEYFNLEGRGMYSYLTGSASWFILTMLTEAFGVKGKQGDLLIKPKLSREQFRFSDTISINRIFAGKRIKVTFTSTKSTSFNNCKIISASLDNEVISITDPRSIVIKRNEILKLTEGNVHHISILLG